MSFISSDDDIGDRRHSEEDIFDNSDEDISLPVKKKSRHITDGDDDDDDDDSDNDNKRYKEKKNTKIKTPKDNGEPCKFCGLLPDHIIRATVIFFLI